ncbi:MAG: flagellar hook-length control protein FliK [Pseudomonas sp.]|nr:flagellar hook-length control protein FliK [Pseudomonas sp.]
MDITALLGATPATPTPGPAGSETEGAAFAQTLNEANERLASADVTAELPVMAEPTLTTTVTPTTVSVAAKVTEPAVPAPTLASTIETPVVIAEPVATPLPTLPPDIPVQTGQAAEPQAPESTLGEMPLDLPAVTTDATDPAPAEHDDPLQHIRQRMHLIDTAGSPDASASVAAQTYVPQAAPATPVSADATPEALAVTAPRSTALVNVDSKADTQADTDDSVNTPSTEPVVEVVAQASVVAVQPQADDANADSDAPSEDTPDNLMSFPAWSPVSSATASPVSSMQSNLTLNAAIGTDAWQSGLSQQVLGLHQRGEKQVDLQLHPTDLGPLSISLKLDSTGTQAQFVAAHASVRAAVEQAIPQLRESLAAQGISLGQTSVSDQPSRQQAQSQPGWRDTQASDEDSESAAEVVPASRPLSTLVDVYT